MADVIQYDPLDSDVPGRVTKHFRSVHTPDYQSLSDTLINPDLTSLSVPLKHWKESGGVVVEMTTAEKETVDLEPVRTAKLAEIVAKTNTLLAGGYVWESQTYSLTDTALIWLNTLRHRSGTFAWPLRIGNKGLTVFRNLDDSTDAINLFVAGSNRLRYITEEETKLVESIMGEMTVAGVQGITDNRI